MQSLKPAFDLATTLLLVIFIVLLFSYSAMESASLMPGAHRGPLTTFQIPAKRMLPPSTPSELSTAWSSRHWALLGAFLHVVVLIMLLAQCIHGIPYVLHNILMLTGLLTGHPRHAPPQQLCIP